MIYYTYKTSTVHQFIQDIFQNKMPAGSIGFGILNEPFTWIGKKKDLTNEQQLQRAQVRTQITEGRGGTGVMAPGSVAIIKIDNTQEQVYSFIQSIFAFLIKKLKERNIICHQEGNDLVLTKDNRKLCGYSIGQTPAGKFFCGVYINVHIKAKLIDKVCIQKRQPFGLGEYHITAIDLEQWFHEL